MKNVSRNALWAVFVAFAWLLKFALWLPLMTIDLYEERVPGETRAMFIAAISVTWPAFGLLVIGGIFDRSFFFAGSFTYLMLGVFAMLGYAYTADIEQART